MKNLMQVKFECFVVAYGVKVKNIIVIGYNQLPC